MSLGDPDKIKTRSELVSYIRHLRKDLREHPDLWENVDLDRYLDALAAWTADMSGFFRNQGRREPDQPSWALIGWMLSSAAIYE